MCLRRMITSSLKEGKKKTTKKGIKQETKIEKKNKPHSLMEKEEESEVKIKRERKEKKKKKN
jgi:hypothetical protein